MVVMLKSNYDILKLRRILNCAKGDNHDLLPSVLTLGKFGSFSNEVEPLYFGSVLAQCLLRYAEKKEIVTSTVRLPAEQIVKLGCHQYGSHYVEAFLRSANTDDRKVFNVKLQPCIFQLANNKYGSRVVEAALDTSDTDGKALFLKSLVTHEKELLSTAHGKVLALKYFLGTFSQDEFRWAKQIQKRENLQEKYKELLLVAK